MKLSDPPITGKMNYLIGKTTIDRNEYWNMTDDERQSLHDKYDSGSKAIPFDMKFAEKHGRKENINNIIETFDGDYKMVYHSGPLSCSVAGGMDLQIKNKSGELEMIHLSPGWVLEKI